MTLRQFVIRCDAALTLLAALAVVSLVGCRQEMADQPSLRPLEGSPLFPKGQSALHLVEGTVPRPDPLYSREFLTGMRGQTDAALTLTVERTDLQRLPYVDEFPFPMTAEVLRRGRDRYQAFCWPCHDPLGYGNGVVVERGFTKPPTLHSDRLRQAPPGYLFDVIHRGFGAMAEYGTQIPPRDHWAIVGHIKVLQASQHLRLDELPEAERQAILERLEATDGKRQ